MSERMNSIHEKVVDDEDKDELEEKVPKEMHKTNSKIGKCKK